VFPHGSLPEPMVKLEITRSKDAIGELGK